VRYYKIVIDGTTAFTSLLPNGQTDPGALKVELDIISAPMGAPGGDSGASVRVWGIPLSTIGQSSNFNGKSISVYGGMSKGLPLANPAQQGLLVQGLIAQAYGNWIGTNMTLDFIITAGANAAGSAPGSTSNPGQQKTASGTGAITPATPLNLVLNWAPGTTLATAIQNALKTALPTFTPIVNISSQLVNTTTKAIIGFYQNLKQFADEMQRRSISIISSSPYGGTGYRGVQHVVSGNTINVYDGQGSNAAGAAKAIAFTDLVGQPTWRSAYLIQVTCVMRGDLQVGQTITLPPSQITVQGNLSSFAPGVPRDTSIFQGSFEIQQLRHVGDFKSPRGEAWATMIDCFTSTAASAATNPGALGGSQV
jgi:hypothetical protein